MARFNGMVAALATAGLVLAQPAAAATRTAAATGAGEAMLEEYPGSTMVVGLIGLVGVIFVIMAITDGDDSDDFPESP